MTETWLVTGAAGFLGVNAGLRLRTRVRLVGQTRVPCSLPLFHEQRSLDLRDASAVAELVRDVRPDVILHAAAISGHETCANDPEQAYAVNVDATKLLSATAADIGARIISISTDAVFSGATGDYSEDDEPDPFSYYGETKMAGEAAVRESGADFQIVRTNFFGWSSTGTRSVLEFFVNALREGRPVEGYPDFVVTSMYVQTLVETLWLLQTKAFVGTVHVASSDALSKYDFGVAVANEFGLDAGLIAHAAAAAGALSTSRSRNLSLNTSRLSQLLAEPVQSQAMGIAYAHRDELEATMALRGISNAPS